MLACISCCCCCFSLFVFHVEIFQLFPFHFISFLHQIIEILQSKLLIEDKSLQTRLKDLMNDWDHCKIKSANFSPPVALEQLTTFETQFSRIQETIGKMHEAQEILLIPIAKEFQVNSILDEITNLKSMWIRLYQVWTSLQELRETMWVVVVPRKVKQSIDKMLEVMHEMPHQLHQQIPFELLQNLLKSYLKVNVILNDLKSEAIGDRHWKTLIKHFKRDNLNVISTVAEMTLGQLWDLKLLHYEKTIKEIVAVAQGEMAVEEYLSQVSLYQAI